MKKTIIVLALMLTACGQPAEMTHEDKVSLCKEIKKEVDHYAFNLVIDVKKPIEELESDLEAIAKKYGVPLETAKTEICRGDYSVKEGKYIN